MKTLLLFVAFTLCSIHIFSQPLPEQDCINAIVIEQPLYIQLNPFSGSGNIPNEINSSFSCLSSGEKNDVWYRFDVHTGGLFCFSLIPFDLTDDYDWAVFNLTNSSCNNIFSDSALEVSCNYSPTPGITGANDSSGSQNSSCIPVNAGETYVINISLFVPSPNGYTIDFSATTAEFGCSGTTIITGVVFNDADTNCLLDSSELENSAWLIKAEPGPVYGYYNHYSSKYHLCLDSGSYSVNLIDDNDFKDKECFNTGYSLTVSSQTEISSIDFGVKTTVFCPLLSVDISTWALRPCMQSTYTVHYCNNGTIPADSAYIEVEFDSEILPLSSTIPWSAQNGNIYTFYLGTVAVNQCGDFYIEADVSCAAVIGSTHCIEAHIYPDSICFPTDTTWDHSSVSVEGICSNDSLACFTIYNSGDDMQGTSQYRIYENNVLVDTGTFQLAAGDSIVICHAANGFTIRLEADQGPGHPGNSHPQANVELCGGIPPAAMGFITQVSEDDADIFIEVDCRQITTSFDPNAKLVNPAGISQNHFIDSSDILEFQINFQNTGTDTAFKIVVRDTLNQNLDITTVQSGASSHPYSFRIYGQGILEWTFNNVLLPDSNTNEPSSHGFVRFKAKQQAGNAIGTVIENRAAIYFDFNVPVITNTTFNTIWEEPALSVSSLFKTNKSVFVYPNPSNGKFVINSTSAMNTIEIFNLLGERISRDHVSSSKNFDIDLSLLPNGIYFIKVYSGNGIYNQKLIKQ